MHMYILTLFFKFNNIDGILDQHIPLSHDLFLFWLHLVYARFSDELRNKINLITALVYRSTLHLLVDSIANSWKKKYRDKQNKFIMKCFIDKLCFNLRVNPRVTCDGLATVQPTD